MFTGITRGLFPAEVIKKKDSYLRYKVFIDACFTADIKISDSISVNGVCQTVVDKGQDFFEFEAIEETLYVTNLRNLKSGDLVSIEPSLCFGDPIGGHISSGHVLGTAKIVRQDHREDNLTLKLQCPKEWMEYILPKGFITLEGSSLTIGNISQSKEYGFFEVYLIPETRRLCNFDSKKIGDLLNLEIDSQTQTIVNTVKNYLDRNKYNNFLKNESEPYELQRRT